MSQICRTKSPTRIASRKGRRKRAESIEETNEAKQEENSLTTPSICYLKPSSAESTQTRGRTDSCNAKTRSTKLKARSFGETVDVVESQKKKNISNNLKDDELSEVGTYVSENILKNELENTKLFSLNNSDFQDNYSICFQSKEKVYHPKDNFSQPTEKQIHNNTQSVEDLNYPEDFSADYSKSSSVVNSESGYKKLSNFTDRVQRETELGKTKQEGKEKNEKEQDKKEREKVGVVYNLKPIAQNSSRSRVSLYKPKSKTNNEKLRKVPEIIIDQHDLNTSLSVLNNIKESLTGRNNVNESSASSELKETSTVLNDTHKCSTACDNIKENSKICLDNDSKEIENGLKEIESGLKEIDNGSKEIVNGLNEIDNGFKESSSVCSEIKESTTLCNNLKENLILCNDSKITKYDKNISNKTPKSYTHGKNENGITNNYTLSKQLNSNVIEHIVKENTNDCTLIEEDNLERKKAATENCHTTGLINNNEQKLSNKYPLSKEEKSNNSLLSNKNDSKEYTLTRENISDLSENNFSENTNGHCNVMKQKFSNDRSFVKENNSTFAKFTNLSDANDRKNAFTNKLTLNTESNNSTESELISSENKNPIKKKWISPYLRSRGSLKK